MFLRGRTLPKLMVFSVLMLLTFCFAFLYDRFQAKGPELLVDPNFSEGLARWQCSGPEGSVEVEAPGLVRLSSPDTARYIGLTQIIPQPERYGLLRFSGDIRSENVQRGKRGWHNARLILSSYDTEGNWLPAPHHVAALTGSHGWHRYSQVFRPVPGADALHAAAQLARAAGVMWVRNLSLREVEEKASYVYWQTTGIFLWGVFLLWWIIPYVGKARSPLWRLAVFAAFTAVLTGKLVPGEILSGMQHKGADVSHEILQAASLETEASATHLSGQMTRTANGGHVVLFVVLGGCLVVACPAVSVQTIFVETGMLAGATELLQFFVKKRTPLFSDWLLDLTGLGLGLILCAFFRRKGRRVKPIGMS